MSQASAPPASPKLEQPTQSPPSYDDSLQQIPQSPSPVMFSNLYPKMSSPLIHERAQADANDINHMLTSYESWDETIERYKGYSAQAIAATVLASMCAGLFSLFATFAGFTLIPTLMAVIDTDRDTTNFTMVLGTAGTMYALYQTDSMKEIMNATVAQMEGLWNWDNMSNTTHEFLTFNVAFTLSLFAGLLAQGLLNGAIAVADQHSQKKLNMS